MFENKHKRITSNFIGYSTRSNSHSEYSNQFLSRAQHISRKHNPLLPRKQSQNRRQPYPNYCHCQPQCCYCSNQYQANTNNNNRCMHDSIQNNRELVHNKSNNNRQIMIQQMKNQNNELKQENIRLQMVVRQLRSVNGRLGEVNHKLQREIEEINKQNIKNMQNMQNMQNIQNKDIQNIQNIDNIENRENIENNKQNVIYNRKYSDNQTQSLINQQHNIHNTYNQQSDNNQQILLDKLTQKQQHIIHLQYKIKTMQSQCLQHKHTIQQYKTSTNQLKQTNHQLQLKHNQSIQLMYKLKQQINISKNKQQYLMDTLIGLQTKITSQLMQQLHKIQSKTWKQQLQIRQLIQNMQNVENMYQANLAQIRHQYEQQIQVQEEKLGMVNKKQDVLCDKINYNVGQETMLMSKLAKGQAIIAQIKRKLINIDNQAQKQLNQLVELMQKIGQ